MNEPPDNQAREDRAQDLRETNGAAAENGGAPAPPREAPAEGPQAPGKRPEEFHRLPTRSEKFRGWVDGLPRMRFYVTLLVITWLSLTVLISLDPRPTFSTGGLPGSGAGYEVGSVARDDVFAQRGVTYVDPVATEAAREEARDEAPVAYRQDAGIPTRQTEAAAGFFDEVRGIRASGGEPEEKVARVTGAAPFPLPENAARSLVFLEDEEVDEAERYVVENLDELYGTTPVGDDGVEEAASGSCRSRRRASGSPRPREGTPPASLRSWSTC
ncbi:hypothetical protein GBA65_10080 [Rubrobacter marinus]|uniref:Metal-dependent phosphohydrolase 7TM extracellular domain-containing protein n=1 Tax=Rubrobacter marinus TaxID=2653852 RepID=A0A6G8PX64_9ACTN|nr:hypothetical protein [Rubrobacter marinus]QIN78811.1 hypothetical protein GBA65_10080 [Rubrobacter marinus]